MQKKSFLITEILSFLVGFLGVHRFYTGYIGIGIAQLLTLGGCGIWSFIDFIMISIGKYKDAKGQDLEEYNSKVGYALIAVYIILWAAMIFNNMNNLPKPAGI